MKDNTSVVPFDFNGNQIRTIVDEQGEPWFVAKDVATVLGYQNTVKAINDHCKGVTKRDLPTEGGIQSMSTIPERDLYRLVMHSKLPAAQEFEEWVVGTVLPSIRKHGAYMTPQKIEEVLMNPDTIIQLAQNLKQEMAKRLEAEKQITLMVPKVENYNEWLDSDGLYTLETAGRLLGHPKKAEFCKLLRDLGYLTKEMVWSKSKRKYVGFKNQPISKYEERGLLVTKLFVSPTGYTGASTKVTPSGLEHLRDVFKRNGLLIRERIEACS